MVKVSVIIPVFNVQEHIGSCLDSVLSQTLENIEVICVDDASTDRSLEILKAISRRDKRVKVISFEKNASASQARKAGVMASSGEVVMFLDGDDVLLPKACELAYMHMKAERVDVVHFGVKVINRSGVAHSRIEWNQKKMAPHLARLEGDLLRACFVDQKFFFTLWNKAFRGDLARTAFSFVEDGSFPRAQDLYAVFLLLYFSKTYVGIPAVLVVYNFGTGITGLKQYQLSSFKRFAQASKVPDAIERFVNKREGAECYVGMISNIRKNLLVDTLGQWVSHLQPNDMGVGYDLLTKSWSAEELVATIAEKTVSEPARYDVKSIAENLVGSRTFSKKQEGEVRAVGVFYYRYHSGGVQRVISLLIPLFLKWGYKVVLITEEDAGDGEYDLPAGVVREIIPAFVRGSRPNYRSRAERLSQVIRKHKIDVFNTHATSGPELLFDLMLAKTLGCYVVLSRHELAFTSFLSGYELPVRQPAVFALSDKLTCLTRMDAQYYRVMGVPAVFIPNPAPNLRIQPNAVENAGPVIIWVGRLDYSQKQCLEPIEIMREVVTDMPEAQLWMVGGGWSENAAETLKAKIKALSLSENVKLCGYTPRPEVYYREAACHLMTSSWENYPMVIEEGRSYGLPLVLYELPYLELLRNRKGYISVRQGDRKAAADTIVKLLRCSSLRAKIGREAQEELLSSKSQFECETQWKELLSFGKVDTGGMTQYDGESLKLLMSSMLELYGRGVIKLKRETAAAKAELKKNIQTKAAAPLEKGDELSFSRSTSNPDTVLKRLLEKREKYGSIGAIDFLIKLYKARL